MEYIQLEFENVKLLLLNRIFFSFLIKQALHDMHIIMRTNAHAIYWFL